MNCRIAADLETSPLSLAHSSTRSMSSGGKRRAISGSLPVAGRPRFLGITFIVDRFVMEGLYLKP